MKVLLVSADPTVREQMGLVAKAAGRRPGASGAGDAAAEPVDLLEAANGARGIALAWKHRPEVVVADQITSTAGAFALTKELKGADPPFSGRVIVLLDRKVDEWLARWSGADAWFVKPVDPFALADAVRGSGSQASEVAGAVGPSKEVG